MVDCSNAYIRSYSSSSEDSNKLISRVCLRFLDCALGVNESDNEHCLVIITPLCLLGVLLVVWFILLNEHCHLPFFPVLQVEKWVRAYAFYEAFIFHFESLSVHSRYVMLAPSRIGIWHRNKTRNNKPHS